MNSIRSRVLVSGSLLLALLAIPLPALADATPEDRASADQLYNDASKLMTAGKHAEACPKLGASQRLDPAIGTLLKLGFCFTYTGQTASAWASFNDAEAMARKAGDKTRADEAARRARDLEAKLSRLVIESAAPDVEVRRDGALVDRSVLGAALPVDPGEHAITASAPGKEPWSSAITIAVGPGTTTVRVPALTLSPVAAAPPVATSTAPAVAADPALKPAEGWSTQRKVALGVGGAGVVGVVVGAVFGAMTLSKTGAAKGHCSEAEPPQCDQEGLTLHGDAKTTANVSNVAMAVGGAALIGGVVLFLTAPAGEAKRAEQGARVKVLPVVGMGSTGVLLQGVW
ncbi:MAG: hypothetical protein ACMG6S_29575 [Byssovorax sp.]